MSNMIVIDERLSSKISNIGFLCACMVVGIHVHVSVDGALQAGIHRFLWAIYDVAVPMFFIIAGFLLAGHFGETGWWMREVKKRVRSLVLPYCIWNLVFLFFSCALTFAAASVGETYGGASWNNPSLVRLMQALGVIPPWKVEIPYLWFVRSLIAFAFCAPMFLFAKRKYLGALVIFMELMFAATLPYLLPPADDWQVHFMKTAWASGLCFFSIGTYLRWNGLWVMQWMRKIPLSALMTILIGVYLAPIPKIMVIMLTIIVVWRIVPAVSWPKWLTGSAFPIYLLQHFVLVSFIAVYRVCGIKEVMRTSLTAYFIQVPFVIGTCIGLALLLRKLCPSVAMVVFGGR